VRFTLNAWNEVVKVIVIILIINYCAPLIIITFPLINFKFMNFKFSSLQYVQLSCQSTWILTLNVSWISGCASSRAIVFLIQLTTVVLPSCLE